MTAVVEWLLDYWQTVELRSSVSRRCVNATYPHTPAGCCHSRSHCGSSRWRWGRGLNTVRSCIFQSQTSRTRLRLRSERQFWVNKDRSMINDRSTTVSLPMNARWFSTEETDSGSNPMPWGHSLLKSSGKKKNQRQQWSILVCFYLRDDCGLHTSPWDRASVDLTVVSPACPHRAAALLLCGVPGQNIITEICIV